MDASIVAEERPRALSRVTLVTVLAIAGSIALMALQTVAARRLELSFDEAYYTLWSRSLAFGYLDHPPMVAVLIRASTALFGGSELGVRAVSLLLVGALPPLVALIAWRLFGAAETAALAILKWMAMPLVMAGAVFVTPDTPLVVFWTLGLAALVELWRSGKARWLLAIGVALGLMLQSKFTAAFFAAGVALAFMTAPSLRRWLVSPAAAAAIAIAAAIFAPFVVWNAEHGWVTFIKQLGRAPPHGFEPFYVFEFFAAQIGREVDEAVAFFRERAEKANLDEEGTAAAEVYVMLLIRLRRFADSLDEHIRLMPSGVRTTGFAPTVVELARLAGDYDRLMAVSRQRGDLLGFAAGLLSRDAR